MTAAIIFASEGPVVHVNDIIQTSINTVQNGSLVEIIQ